jgi:uncharacterized protein
MSDITNNIKDFVLRLCDDGDKNINLWYLHLHNVVKYSRVLAVKLNADVEICELSAWLHDISKIEGNKKNHHISSAKRAREILQSYIYPDDKIKIIESAIITHSSDENFVPKTIEQKILASADALAFFEDFLVFAHKVIHVKKLSLEDAKLIFLEKLDVSWKKASLLDDAKKIAEPRYETIKSLLL